MSAKIDLTGMRPDGSILLVLKPAASRHGKSMWECLCDCGTTAILQGPSIRRGATKSCGCLRRERCRELGKKSLPKGESVRNNAFTTAIKKAREHGQEFALSKEQYFKIVESNCFYCGTAPFRRFKGSKNLLRCDFICNGMDRVDSSKGYTLDNVVPCCRPCNVAKSDMTQSAFLQLIHKIHSNMISKIASA